MNKREVSFYTGMISDDFVIYGARLTVEMQSSSPDYHIMGLPGTVEVQSIWFAGESEKELSESVTAGLEGILQLLSDQDFYLLDPQGIVQGTPYFHASALLGRYLRMRLDGDTLTKKEFFANVLWMIYGDTTVRNVASLVEGARHYGREVKVLSGETK